MHKISSSKLRKIFQLQNKYLLLHKILLPIHQQQLQQGELSGGGSNTEKE